VLNKTIQSFDFATGLTANVNDSASAAFNDLGQLAWRVQFTDSTTAIMRTTVPAAVDDEDSADFDSDGDVDGADFLTWQRNNGTTVGATLEDGNANEGEDGDVDGDDLAVWEDQFGASVPAANPVPEPGAFGLAAILGSLAWFSSRRRAVGRIGRRWAYSGLRS
jgi:hypothetical protein